MLVGLRGPEKQNTTQNETEKKSHTFFSYEYHQQQHNNNITDTINKIIFVV